jgi:hypothetical protein
MAQTYTLQDFQLQKQADAKKIKIWRVGLLLQRRKFKSGRQRRRSGGESTRRSVRYSIEPTTEYGKRHELPGRFGRALHYTNFLLKRTALSTLINIFNMAQDCARATSIGIMLANTVELETSSDDSTADWLYSLFLSFCYLLYVRNTCCRLGDHLSISICVEWKNSRYHKIALRALLVVPTIMKPTVHSVRNVQVQM